MITKSVFYYLRHGETDWNREHRAQGQTDVPLNDTGLIQARRASEIVRKLDIKTICTSPLSRALDTARMLMAEKECELAVIDELTECSWGGREGEIKGHWFTDWKSGSSTPQGAESYTSFIERALRGINLALEKPGPVIVVSHGGVYWAVQKFANLGEEFDIPNATPVLHIPPETGKCAWRTSIIAKTI